MPNSIKWLRHEQDGAIHIVPATMQNGDWEPMKPHVPNAFCSCHPTVEYLQDGGEVDLMIVHEVIH